LARWHASQGDAQASLQAYQALQTHAPQHVALVAQEWLALASAQGQGDTIHAALVQQQTELPSVDIMQTLAQSAPSAEAARAHFMAHLERKPSLLAATQFLAIERLEHEQFHPQVQRALDAAVKPMQRYKCGACGFVSQTHFWQCPGCQSWDSIPAQRLEEL
jgi:lipopolysaccharide assembly protein B